MNDISIIFKKRNKQDDHYHSYIRIYSNGKTQLIGLRRRFKCEDVNWGGSGLKEKRRLEKLRLKGNYIKSSVTDSDSINKWFKNILNENIGKYGKDKSSFIHYVGDYIDSLTTKKNYGTRNGYMVFLKNLNEFLDSKSLDDLKYSRIDHVLINDYQEFLLERGLEHSTINNHILRFKKMYELSIKEGHHVPMTNIFLRHEYLKQVPKPKDSLSFEEVKTMLYSPSLKNPVRGYYYHLDDEGYEKQQPIEISKNIFLFQILGGGLRVSDVIFLQFSDLEFSDDKCVIKTRSFKSNSIMSIPINDSHLHVIKKCLPEKYQFTRYSPLQITCPRCNSSNIMSGGSYKHNIRRRPKKCRDCSRSYTIPKQVGINYIFNDVTPEHFKLTQSPSDTIYPIHIVNEFEERNKRIPQLEKDRKDVLEILSRPKEHRESYRRIYSDDERLLSLLQNPEQSLELINQEIDSYDDWLSTWWGKFIREENIHYMNIFKELKDESPNKFLFGLVKEDEFPELIKDKDKHFKEFFTEYQYKRYMYYSRRHNSLLKQVQKHFKFDVSLSTHTGRHTFTRIGLLNKVSLYTLSKLLLHKSIKTTEKYLKHFDEEVVHDEIEDKFYNKFRF